MKNKKYLILIILLSTMFSFFIFYIIDSIYYSEVTKLIDPEQFGYKNSFIMYSDKIRVFVVLAVISAIYSIFIYHIYTKRETQFTDYLEVIKKKLKEISNGDYSFHADDVEKLGVTFDEFSKLIIELREKSDIANKERLKLKESLQDISHQIKTPIASIKILIELEKSNPGEFLEQIDQDLNKINTLVSNMLVLAKLDINQIAFRSEKIYIKDIINTSIESLVNIINEKNISIEIVGEDFIILGDYYWLVEAFINIIKNSIEYSKTEVVIKLQKDKAFNSIYIEDDGDGFLEDELTKIFHRFYQSKNNNEGVGIGLNMAQNILKNQNATIKAENNNGGVFIIKFYKN